MKASFIYSRGFKVWKCVLFGLFNFKNLIFCFQISKTSAPQTLSTAYLQVGKLFRWQFYIYKIEASKRKFIKNKIGTKTLSCSFISITMCFLHGFSICGLLAQISNTIWCHNDYSSHCCYKLDQSLRHICLPGAPQINGSAGPSSVNGIHTCKGEVSH